MLRYPQEYAFRAHLIDEFFQFMFLQIDNYAFSGFLNAFDKIDPLHNRLIVPHALCPLNALYFRYFENRIDILCNAFTVQVEDIMRGVFHFFYDEGQPEFLEIRRRDQRRKVAT